VNEDVPLLATITRITYQKGIDVLVRAIEQLAPKMDFQFILLGTGDADIIRRFQDLNEKYPDRIAVFNGYDDSLAHRIEAGADIYAMPSRYEPCGLNQMYSLRYGTIPVVRATGGLDDTVEEWNSETKEGTGFKFGDLSIENLTEAIIRALDLYHSRDDWELIRKNAMREKAEWITAVREYERVYEYITHGPGHVL
jgi:starch synthase